MRNYKKLSTDVLFKRIRNNAVASIDCDFERCSHQIATIEKCIDELKSRYIETYLCVDEESTEESEVV